MVNGFFRRTGFWIIDLLKGGEIRKNYIDIKNHFRNNKVNDEKLSDLLAYATKNVPFYKEYDEKDILSFPVINKNDIKENWEQLHSTAYDGPVHLMSTSGSTGTPFTMEWDIGKRKRQLAEVIYFN